MERASGGDGGVATASPRAGAAASTRAVVARQAIYDAGLRVVAYELLFRSGDSLVANPTDAEAATAEVLVTAFADIGLDELVGDHRAFVNIPYRFLVDGYCSTLPKDRVVLEILEDVEITDPLIRVVRSLAAEGFTIALDDFEFREGVEPLVELADIVKLDILALSPANLVSHVERLRAYDVKLAAEKVERRDQINELRNMGFEYFQGFALDRPVIVHSTRTSANRAVMLQLVSELHDPNKTVSELVDTVARDPSTAYALLRILNSGHFFLLSRVTSLQQALVLFGVDGLRNWATMMVMTRLADGADEAVNTALVRAKMCESCAQNHGAHPASAFTVGLLSALPDILGEPLPDLMRRLSLEPSLERAILEHQGSAGETLACVLAYESNDRERLSELQAPTTMANTFLEAVRWSSRANGLLATARRVPTPSTSGSSARA